MRMLTGKEGAKRVSGCISKRHQVHAYTVELTANQVYSLRATGAVDFGGSELLPAEPVPLPTFQKHSQDRYQWWTLVHGAYLVEFNETLDLRANETALLEPHERMLRAGAEHSTRFLRGKMDPVYAILNVTTGKVELKQNARISSLRFFSLDSASATPSPQTRKRPAKKKPAKKKTAGKKVAKRKSKRNKSTARKTAKKKRR